MSAPGRYAAHAAFVAPAVGTPGLRPVILSFILVESFYETGQRLLHAAIARENPDLARAMIAGDSSAGLLLNLGSFAVLGISVAVVLRAVHGQGVRSLLGPGKALRPQFGATFLAVALVFLAWELGMNGPGAGPAAILRPLPDWLILLGPALAALLVQTGAEELFYRGYLQQRIAALMPHPASWLILPNIPFALAHFSGQAGLGENLTYMTWAFCFGLAASDLTARAGTLGPALAMHLANNAYAFLFFAEAGGPDSGLALVLFPPGSALAGPAPSLVSGLSMELLLLALTWAGARLAIRR